MAKRPYGRGGLYKRGRVWWIKYFVQRYPVWESARTQDKKQAEALLKQRLAEVQLDQLPDPQSTRVTVANLLNMLVSDYKLRNRASLRQLESRVSKHLVPLLGGIRAAEFNLRHVDAYVKQRRNQKASDATINRELEHVRAAYRLAVDHELLTRVPKIRMLEEDNVRSGFLEHNQYIALRNALPDYLVPLFVTGYHVGCRLGELLKLKWEQVDFAAGQIWLEKRQTKAKVPRILPLYGEMREVLFEAHGVQQAKHPWAELVFQRNGKRIVDFRKAWAKACCSAGLPNLTFHDLRRSAVRNMDRAEIPRTTIRRIIGHETDAMFDRYRIVGQRDIREAGEKAELYLRSQTSRGNAADRRSESESVTKTVTNSADGGASESDCNQNCDQSEGNGGEQNQ